MEPLFYLTDRGIRQAVERGFLRFDPPLEDRQVQPASVDLFLDSFEGVFRTEAYEGELRRGDGLVIPGQHETTLRATQTIDWVPPLGFHGELRSSLRRLACYTPVGNIHLDSVPNGSKMLLEVNNQSLIDLVMSPGDKFAQALFTFYKTDDAYFFERDGYDSGGAGQQFARFGELRQLDHGWTVTDECWLRWLHEENYFQVLPEFVNERQLLRVHAGSTARVLRDRICVDFSSRKSIDDAFETVELPYRLMPGEHIVVDTRESLKLSPHVGVHFYDNLLGTTRGITHRSPRQRDFPLSCLPDGWVDPGYEGTFSRQPKTLDEEGVVISPGDVLGHGVVIFYPNGVGREYGSEGLNSHYQHQTRTQITQSKKE